MTRLTVPTPPSFRFRTTLRSHGWIALAPFGHDEAVATLWRVQRLANGAVVRLTVTEVSPAAGAATLEAEIEGLTGPATTRQRREVAAAVRRIFNLDLELAAFYHRLRDEPAYAWVERAGAGRLLRSPTVWEDLTKILMTTNTTWGGTRGMVRRIAELGDPYGDGAEGLHAFPAPERIAALSPEALAAAVRAGYRSAYLHRLATAIAEGRLDVESWAEPGLPAEELYRRVRSLQGFGPYAAGATLKLLGAFDQLALDTAARAMFTVRHRVGAQATDREIEAHYAPYGPWRGLVLWMDLLHHHLGAELATGAAQ
jgi:3-methyladenine DNA glycosylase/8-oxoguanine DNA glycosylase